MDNKNSVKLFLVAGPCLNDFLQLAWLAGANPLEQHPKAALFAVEAAHVEGFLSLAQRSSMKVTEQAQHETAY